MLSVGAEWWLGRIKWNINRGRRKKSLYWFKKREERNKFSTGFKNILT
jgi:hypothetical protein